MQLLQTIAGWVGRGASSAGNVAGRSSVALARLSSTALAAAKEAYQAGARQTVEHRRQAIVLKRSQALNIEPAWYDKISEEFGEDTLIEALLEKSEANADRETVFGWRGLTEDPFEPVASWGGWRERPSMLSYELGETLARRIGPFTAYLQTRLNQVASFCKPQDAGQGIGFVVRKKGAFSKGGKKPKKDEKDQRAEDLTQILLNSGTTPKYDTDTGQTRDGLVTCTRKLMRDTLIHDQMCLEKQRDVKGRLVSWRVLDAKTIRLTSPHTESHNWFKERIRYAQVLNGVIVADFSAKDLAFVVRNPRSDIRIYGYGYSELEMMVNTITALLNGFEHNARYFSQGTTAKGMLQISGAVPPQRLRAFKHVWYSMVSGAQNAWRTPILNIPDEKSQVKWIDLQKSNLDMEWSKFMEWCLKVSCGVWQIAPEEIGFQFGNQGQSGSLQQGGSKEKVEASKDRGLPPLLTSVETLVNEHIMAELDPDYEFKIVGLDQRTEEAETEILTKQVGTFRYIDEARAAMDLDPLPDGLGECVLNPTWVQFASQKKMEQQQAQQQQPQGGFPGVAGFLGGQPGAPPPGGPPGPGAAPPPGAGPPGPPGGMMKARVERYIIDL